MAGDSFNWDVLIRLMVQSANSKQEIENIQSAVDGLYKSMGRDVPDNLSRSIVAAARRTNRSLQSTLDLENKLANAQAKRAAAENSLVRGATKSGDQNISKMWDAEFKAASKAADENAKLLSKQEGDWTTAMARLEAIQRKRTETEVKELNRLDNAWSASQQKKVQEAEKAAAAEQRAQEKRAEVQRRTQEREAARLKTAQASLSSALGKERDSREVSDLGRIAAAQERVARAVQERSRAEASLQRARGGSGEAAATTALTNAVREQTSAEKALSSARDAQYQQAISLRYANYDLAQSMFTVSAAITAMGAGAVTAFASQERAFADVIRTTDENVAHLEDSFRELSTTIPNSFNELAQIGTLGNQLGVPAAQLEAFTETIAQFSTVTGISAEESALAFGKLGNLLGVMPDEYDRLASSIALVGRETAATEQQIISVAGEIAPAAAAAGFTADQVVGLSGALSSLKVPPERSRSTILQFFETLNMAVAEGGDKLDNFASVVGVTAGELESMVRSGQGQDILSRFLGNVSSSDTIEITQALENLGLAGLRTNPTIRALAGNMQLLNQSFADGNRGWAENTELQRQMDVIMGTLAAKWQVFLNAAMNVAATIGSSVAPAFAVLLEGITNVLIGLQGFAESDFGQVFFRVVGVLGAGVAVFAALRGAIALATGGLLAFTTVARFAGGAGLISGLKAMGGAFLGIQGAAHGAAASTLTFRNVLLALGRATVILGLITAATQLVLDFGGSMQWLAGTAETAMNIVGNAVRQMLYFVGDAYSALGGVFPELGKIGGAITNIARKSEGIKIGGEFKKWAGGLQTANDQLSDFSGDLGAMPWGGAIGGANDLADSLGKGGDGVGGAAKNAQQEVRTLVDYANDLQGVFSRAFDLRFSSGSTLDKITSQFISIREATENSARAIQKLKADIQGLQSDLSIQQYFLGIAIEYGDTKRAEAIQANIAKLQADLADKTASLSDEQSKNSKTLTGNSKAAIDNREKLNALVQSYQDHIVALASSGMGQAELARRTAELRAQFIQQATQLGYSRTEVEKYARAFDDMSRIIRAVPRNVTVTANVNPALQALNEFVAKARKAGQEAGKAFNSGMSSGVSGGGGGNPFGSKANQMKYFAMYSQAMAQSLIQSSLAAANKNPYTALGQISSAAAYRALAEQYRKLGGFSGGGYTGSGGKYEPAGVVHRGEYVIPKKDVNQATGLPYADALGRLQRGASGPGYANGGYVRSSPAQAMAAQIGSLGPMAVQQFQLLLNDAMRVNLDGRTISQNSAHQYAQSTAQGAN